MNPHEESFWASKTMQLIAFAFGVIVFLVAIGVAVEVLFHVSVFDILAAAIGSITALAGGGTYRNTRVDGPIRMAAAGLPTAAYAPPAAPDINVEQSSGGITT